MTEDQLRNALLEGEKSGIVESKERTMVEGVFYLGDRPVQTFMTHRSEIQWIDINTAPAGVCAKAIEFRQQRCFPVADGTLDAIIGAAYLEDIIIDQMAGPQKGLRTIMKEAQFVPQTMPAIKAFEAFKRAQEDYIFVMDEYGGFAGMLSTRDLMEEIVGVLISHREKEDSILPQDDGTWLADGGINIDDAAEQLALPNLASDRGGYHTLAGFILSLAGELPRTGDSFAYGGLKFTVAGMDGNRIGKILVSREDAAMDK
jgi:putative hemolysin